MYENYLAHHGVKGMKWGVRKTAKKFSHLAPKNVGSYAKQRHAMNKQTRKKIRNINSTRSKQRDAKERKHNYQEAGYIRGRWVDYLFLPNDKIHKQALNTLKSKKISELSKHDIETGRQIAKVYEAHDLKVKQLKKSYS